MKDQKSALLALTFGLLGVSVGLSQGGTPENKQPVASSEKPDEKAITDVRDPLPDGALARLGTIRQRVPQWAHLAIRPDGRTFVTVIGGRAVGEWDVASGTLLRQRRLFGAPTEDYWLAPNGQLLAVKGDGNLVIWDLDEGTRRHILPMNPDRVAFSSDGKMLATTEENKSWIDLWDLVEGKNRRLAIQSSGSRDLAFSPDGKRLFASLADGSLRCWDVVSGRQLWKNDYSGWGLIVAPDGRMLCTAGCIGQGKLFVWEADSGRHIKKIDLKKETLAWTNPVAFTADGRSVLLNSREGILVWDLDSGKISCRMPQVARFVLASDGKTAITLTGSLLQRWDIESGRSLYPDTRSLGHGSAVVALAFSPDGRTLATSSAKDTIRLWDLAARQPRTFPARTRRGMLHYMRFGGGLMRFTSAPPILAFTPDGQKLLVESEEGKLSLRRVDNGEETLRLDVCRDHEDRISTARLAPDGRSIWCWRSVLLQTSSKRTDTLFAWNARSGSLLSSRPILSENAVEARHISPDGRYAAVENGTVVDVETGQPRLGDAAHPEKFRSFAFSPDGRLIAAARPPDAWRLRGEVRVYEMLTGRLLVCLYAAVNRVSSYAFSPDGRLLIAAGEDDLYVWEAATGRRLLYLSAEDRLPYRNPSHFATCLAASPDGRSAATGHDDGTVLLWDLAPAWQKLTSQRDKLTQARRFACWDEMLADDPKRAYSGMAQLTADDAETVSFLGDRLRQLPIDRQVMERWLRDLDSDDFGRRERASRELNAVADRIEPRLRQALQKTTSLEVRRRLRDILETVKNAPPPPQTVRQLRCVAVLEHIATPEAQRLLQDLTQGESSARLAAAAQDALRRLQPRK